MGIVAVFVCLNATACGGGSEAEVDAKGTIAFVARNEGALFTIQADGSELRRLTQPRRHRIFGDIAWSPNGRELAFRYRLGYPA